ncbi:hypothetical protein B0T20DRAFT_199739 [Sordaria brevicollis]|uniref:Uncharacterized protein n=1 Tax=Sordaria brevicollis TaxID=83679 RepID=A0AAE0PGJ3_SORBR|nr:hypothetical protein B0T20DRAFT_199739 [Sordaria brevicollis]
MSPGFEQSFQPRLAPHFTPRLPRPSPVSTPALLIVFGHVGAGLKSARLWNIDGRWAFLLLNLCRYAFFTKFMRPPTGYVYLLRHHQNSRLLSTTHTPYPSLRRLLTDASIASKAGEEIAGHTGFSPGEGCTESGDGGDRRGRRGKSRFRYVSSLVFYYQHHSIVRSMQRLFTITALLPVEGNYQHSSTQSHRKLHRLGPGSIFPPILTPVPSALGVASLTVECAGHSENS